MATVMLSFLFTSYYNVILSWAMYYLVASFQVGIELRKAVTGWLVFTIGLIWEDLECLLVHLIVINTASTYYIVTHYVAVFSMTKHCNIAKSQNTLFVCCGVSF